MNNKGQINDVVNNFRVVVAIFMVLIIIGVIALGFILYAGTFLKGFGLLTETLVNVDTPEGTPNISDIAQITLGNYNIALQQLKWISFVLLFAMIMGTTITAMVIRVNQAWFLIYLIFIVVAIFFSIYISNSYETILDSGTELSTSLATFSATSWIVINLPFLIGIVGTIGVVFIFIKGIEIT